TCEEAARAIGCPVGTIGSRLARGREQLRERLVRRGLAPVVGALAAALTSNTQAAVVPSDLLRLTAHLGSGIKVIGKGAGTSSAARLAEDVLRSQLMMKLMSIGAATAAVAGVGLMWTWTIRPGVGASVPPGETRVVVQDKQGREQDPFALMNDADRLKDAAYVEIGNLRPLIEDAK